MDADFIKILATLLTIAGVIVGPSVFYLRLNSNRNDQKNKEMFTEMQSRNKEGFDRLEKSQNDFNLSIKTDLREFRSHLDGRFTDVYSTIDNKMKELKEQFGRDMENYRRGIHSLEGEMKQHNEKAHSIEKDLLRLENVLSKEYITREQLDLILKLPR